MSGIYKKLLVLCVCYLGMVQVQAQVNPRHNPVTPNNTPTAPRPILLPNRRPVQQVMPQQRDYNWYLSQLNKRGGMKTNTMMATKPTAIANPSQMPASRSFEWWQQQLAKHNQQLQQPAARSAVTSQNTRRVMPAQRSYEWYQQQLDASRKRAHLEPLPGNRD